MASVRPGSPSAAGGPAASPALAGRRARAFALLGTVQVTLIFTITLITVPLPVIGREFGLGRSSLILASTAYGLSFSGLLLFGGRLADRRGARAVFTTGLAIFAVASAVAAATPGFAVLVTARFAQGAGAALVAPAAMTVLRAVIADEAGHTRALATWGGLSVLGATSGILLSGVVTTWVSWRWLFAVALLVSVAALLLSPGWLPAVAPAKGTALDLPGALLATAGVTMVSYGLVVTGAHTWSSAAVTVPLVAGVTLLAAFTVAELRSRDPLLPPAFLADRRRATALLAIALSATGTAVAFLFLTLYLQQVRGWSPLRTSLAFAPYALSLAAAGRLARGLIVRFGARAVTGTGLAITAGGLFLLSRLSPHTGYLTGLLPGIVLLPAGAALALAGAAVLAAAGVPARQAGLAGGVMNTAMELGPTAGLALLTAVAAARASHAVTGDSPQAAAASGYAWALGTAGLAAALLAVLTAIPAPPRRSRARDIAPLIPRRPGRNAPAWTPSPATATRSNLMTTRFAGSNVLITGGGTGIGRAIALAFAQEGATVDVAGRSAEPLVQTVKLITDGGGRATAITADVTRSGDVAALVADSVAAYGSLDVAVNNAGMLTAFGPAGDIDEDEWAALVAVNLTGTLLSMKHQIAHMRRNGGGAIVNIASSLGAHKRLAGLGAYVATKAAVSALTRNAALDHVGDGIRINAVSPGPADTPMSSRPGESRADRDARIRDQLPAGRVASLGEIAAAVLYLASPEAGFIIGTDLLVDGGATA